VKSGGFWEEQGDFMHLRFGIYQKSEVLIYQNQRLTNIK